MGSPGVTAAKPELHRLRDPARGSMVARSALFLATADGEIIQILIQADAERLRRIVGS
jgi:hypothetical protein